MSESITATIRRLRELEAKATKGEWFVEGVTNEGDYGYGDEVRSGFDSYKVADDVGKSIVDTLNSEVALVKDDDEAAIDVQGLANVELIVALRNAFPDLLAYVERLEKIVKALPQTADGVPIVPGNTIYFTDGSYAIAPGCVGDGPITVRSDGYAVRCSDGYSTQAAASAAREEKA